ncbi:unnamed protein product [Brassica rapa subsp. trilocularis]
MFCDWCPCVLEFRSRFRYSFGFLDLCRAFSLPDAQGVWMFAVFCIFCLDRRFNLVLYGLGLYVCFLVLLQVAKKLCFGGVLYLGHGVVVLG